MSQPREADIVDCIPHLRRYARGLMGDPMQADDLVQDTLERVWNRFDSWRESGSLRAWAFGIMHNLFLDHVRRRKSRQEDEADGTLPDLPDRATQTDQLEVRDLERALSRLPDEYRSVLLLIAVEELSYKEAASVLGVPIGTVMSRLSRARERLRGELNGTVSPEKLHRVK